MLDSFAIGNLTADPTIRDTNSGSKMCTFTVACRTNQKDPNGGMATAFVQAAVFGRQADTAAMYLKKGSKVAIAGGLSTRDYTAKDGTNRTALQITVDRMEFLTPRGDDDNATQSAAPRSNNQRKTAPQKQETVDDYDPDLPF